MPPEKRLEFFSGQTWDRGLAWYAQQFAAANGAKAIGEASNTYTTYPLAPEAPSRIAETLPDVRLVYLIRHPIERIVSQYKQAAAHWGEERPLDEVVLERSRSTSPSAGTRCRSTAISSIAARATPRHHLRRPPHRRTETLDVLWRFLGVDPALAPADVAQDHHVSSQHRQEGALLKRIRSSPARDLARKVLPTALRRAGWRLASRPVDLKPSATTMSDKTLGHLLVRLRPDLVRLRELLGPGFHAWGLLDELS